MADPSIVPLIEDLTVSPDCEAHGFASIGVYQDPGGARQGGIAAVQIHADIVICICYSALCEPVGIPGIMHGAVGGRNRFPMDHQSMNFAVIVKQRDSPHLSNLLLRI